MKHSQNDQRPFVKSQYKTRLSSLLRQGTEALQSGEFGQAVRFLERAHRLDRDHLDVALNLGGAYILSKQFGKAVAILESLSERDPHNPMVWTNLGAAYLGNPVLASDDNQKQAILAFERAIELDPVTPNVAYNLGLVYRDRRDIDKALYWFRRAVEANPQDRDAQRNVAWLSQNLDDCR